jgi:hypothetical protein
MNDSIPAAAYGTWGVAAYGTQLCTSQSPSFDKTTVPFQTSSPAFDILRLSLPTVVVIEAKSLVSPPAHQATASQLECRQE